MTSHTLCIHAVPEGSRCEICAEVVHIHADEDWPDEMGEGVRYVVHASVRWPPWMRGFPMPRPAHETPEQARERREAYGDHILQNVIGRSYKGTREHVIDAMEAEAAHLQDRLEQVTAERDSVIQAAKDDQFAEYAGALLADLGEMAAQHRTLAAAAKRVSEGFTDSEGGCMYCGDGFSHDSGCMVCTLGAAAADLETK